MSLWKKEKQRHLNIISNTGDNTSGIKRFFCFSILFPVFISLLAGCYSRNGDDDDDTIGDERLIVAGGAEPVWMPDGTGFLYSLKSAADSAGIYLADESGEWIRTLWNEAHNHDYIPSPDGQMVAFSTPDDEGGVWTVDLESAEAESKILNGQHPGWLPDGPTLIAEDRLHRIVRLDNETGDLVEIAQEGYYPQGSPDGSRVAFLVTNQNTAGFNLVVINPVDGNYSSVLAENISSVFTWGPNSAYLYVSQLSTESFGTIYQVDYNSPDTKEELLTSATQPSIGGDGGYLIAAYLYGDRINGIVSYNLYTAQYSLLVENGYHPVAHPSMEKALIEKEGGIYLVTW